MMPGKTDSSTVSGANQKGRRGWGVDSSRDPHWLQISALRGLTCRWGQSFRPYVRPQKLQNNGWPVVMRWQKIAEKHKVSNERQLLISLRAEPDWRPEAVAVNEFKSRKPEDLVGLPGDDRPNVRKALG